MAKIKIRAKEKNGTVTVKSLLKHPMETGNRKDKKTGEKIPRKIINKFTCTYNSVVVFSADWHPAISTNPYLAFNTVATETGTLEFTWVDDDGSSYSKSAKITVQ